MAVGNGQREVHRIEILEMKSYSFLIGVSKTKKQLLLLLIPTQFFFKN
jgi:hypothetical protein